MRHSLSESVNAKFARVDALNKNIAKERAALEDLRRERHRKNAAMDENAKRTAEMQTDIAQRLEEAVFFESN